jgi:hypothetical protein
MTLASFTFVLFAAFSSIRIFSYVPQIRKVATDTNGASAISYSTWALWAAANIATGLYALVNLGDTYLASVSALYSACCFTVIGLTAAKRRNLATTGSFGGARDAGHLVAQWCARGGGRPPVGRPTQSEFRARARLALAQDPVSRLDDIPPSAAAGAGHKGR